jgi:hypothetical protein
MKWVLIFYLASNPQDYRPHTGYIQQENCHQAQQRYSKIFSESGGTMRAECRRVEDVQIRRPSNIMVKHYVLN